MDTPHDSEIELERRHFSVSPIIDDYSPDPLNRIIGSSGSGGG